MAVSAFIVTDYDLFEKQARTEKVSVTVVSPYVSSAYWSNHQWAPAAEIIEQPT